MKVENTKLTREASTSEIQTKLHLIYEQKLEEAVEEEREKMH